MEKILLGIYHYLGKRRILFFVLFFLSMGTVIFWASRIRLEEDISKILPREKKIDQLNQVFQNSKFVDKLVITVFMKDSSVIEPDSLTAFADLLVKNIEGEKLKTFIRKINYKTNDTAALDAFRTIQEHLPVYLTEKDYTAIDSLIRPEIIRQSLEQDIRTLSTPSGLALKNAIAGDPVGISFLALKKLQQLQYDENFQLYDNAILTKDNKHLLLFITPAYPPANTGKNAELLNGLDSAIRQTKQKGFEDIDVSYFGAAAVSAGNARQLRKDSFFTLGLTLAFLVVFLEWYFRKKRAPLLILLPVIFGALFSLSVIYLLKGSISVIAMGTGSVILGIAVSYSIHVFNHYRHKQSMEDVLRDLAMPLTIGSFTTIGGFFCLEFVKSEMLKDLGLFAAFSLIGASFCSLVFLPHFIFSGDKKKTSDAPHNSWIDRLSSIRPEKSNPLILLILILTIIFAYTARWVRFDSDMTAMNFMSPDLKQAEQKLNGINEYSLKSVYLVAEGSSVNEALKRNEAIVQKIEVLKEKNIVKKYSGVSTILLSDSLQKARIARWHQYWTPSKIQNLLSLLRREGATLKFSPAAFDPFEQIVQKDFQPVSQEEMTTLRTHFLDDYVNEKPGSATVVTLLKVLPENKQSVYKAFDEEPGITVLDKQYLTERLVGIINNDFTSIAWMSSILVFSVLLLTYGRIELTLVSFIPMFIAWVWILGIMGLAGIHFNIINIILSALIFGLGDDYSLFIMDGLLQEYKTGKKNLSSFKSSIILSAITTLAGLGVLIFAKHPALKSIAVVSIIGMVCVVLIAQTLIPFLFSLLIQNRIRKKRFPWTFFGYLKSIFSFVYFATGCLLMRLMGLFLIKWNPFNKEKGKYIYHRWLSRYTWSVMYIMGNVKKKIINQYKEDFSKPAVIICNHQSFLDILLTSMLHPKLILLTNNWVWNSPVFGEVVRMADYYPVAQGIENSIDLLSDRIREGYSIVVFPEGTRTTDDTPRRFHKGAFFLAEKLQLDILPIQIHGSGYTMTKSDFLLKNGYITMEFLPRIIPDDDRFGEGYASRAKYIGRFFRDEYTRLKAEREQTRFYREQLIYNYIYKGPVLEWYLIVKLKLEKNYQPFHELFPREGNFLDIGCGYGFMSYMLHFCAPGRKFTGIDYDEEKIEVANRCFSKDAGIEFIYTDCMQFELDQYDGIVLSDLLHYLPPENQQELIARCIDHLKEGGKLVIRDGNKDLGEQHRGTRISEFFSTRVFGFNKTGEQGLSFLSGGSIRDIARSKNMNCREINDARFTSNMIFVIEPKHNNIYHERI